jgi:hypothetical protein
MEEAEAFSINRIAASGSAAGRRERNQLKARSYAYCETENTFGKGGTL